MIIEKNVQEVMVRAERIDIKKNGNWVVVVNGEKHTIKKKDVSSIRRRANNVIFLFKNGTCLRVWV